ncbi:hypothetical protein EPI10_032461 [Gossypium australe]|uniref:Uncharacterized protein n=1 Tax=Gossypium australe TaxID=47621 RepID=A0A5B6X759_9ROSI|nr:hypothetical protein EPI10_032461 [Gossypium australe]
MPYGKDRGDIIITKAMGPKKASSFILPILLQLPLNGGVAGEQNSIPLKENTTQISNINKKSSHNSHQPTVTPVL